MTLESLTNIVSVPTLPEVVRRVCDMVANPEIGMAEIGQELGRDAPLSAKVLSLANSAIYSLAEQVNTTEKAASLIGARALRNLALQASVMEQYEHLKELKGFDIDDIWRHSFLTAALCLHLGKKCRRSFNLDPEELYTCGLLHDLGRIVLLDKFGADYVKVLARAHLTRMPSHLLEKNVFGFSHDDVGATIISSWNLPKEIGQVAAQHHADEETIVAMAPLLIVARADLLAHAVEHDQPPPVDEVLSDADRRRLDLTVLDVEEWREYSVAAAIAAGFKR